MTDNIIYCRNMNNKYNMHYKLQVHTDTLRIDNPPKLITAHAVSKLTNFKFLITFMKTDSINK